jgi:chromosome segregation ATPase
MDERRTEGGIAISIESKDVREDVRRWVEDGPTQLAALAGLLHEFERLRERVATAEREQERLRGLTYENEQLHNRLDTAEHQCDRLREEVTRLRSELEQYQRERGEVAEQLSETLTQVLLRLRPQQV